MAEPLKNIYSEQFIEQLLNCWSKVIPTLEKKSFMSAVFAEGWKSLELKERMSRLAESMELVISPNLKESAETIEQLINQMHIDLKKDGFEYMFFPEFIEKNGLEEVQLSLDLLEKTTQFVSCEFAIRPFIIKYKNEVITRLIQWSKHEHPSVRRLATEGSRPRLPWALALPEFKKDPTPVLPILENLRNDSSLYVRKSVANHLNDISKDHPELALQLAKKWQGKTKETDWVVKHAMRTLLKAGNAEAMTLFGYAPIEKLSITEFTIHTPKVDFGTALKFSFSIENNSKETLSIRMEYGIYFLKSNGQQAKKVFKISERNFDKGEKLYLEKIHTIKPISTRKYYTGEHAIAAIINGIEFNKQAFLLNI